MSKNSDKPITSKEFMRQLWRYKRGSISRRDFLGVTGLGVATAVLGTAMPGLLPRTSWAAGELGDRLVFSTWPNYWNQVNLDEFTEKTGVNIQVNALGPGSIHTQMWDELRDGARAAGATRIYEIGQQVTSGGGASSTA